VGCAIRTMQNVLREHKHGRLAAKRWRISNHYHRRCKSGCQNNGRFMSDAKDKFMRKQRVHKQLHNH
jgi:hypothetical protein